jgi:hypothetical protein
MKTRDDFKPDLDFNLKDWVQDALLAESVDKREPPQFTDESIDQLMKQVYEKIEREALTTYHSNEPWALRQWALGNIMRDEIANEASNEIAHNLISPVLEWQQQQPFDPISKFHEKLVADGKSKHSIKEYMVSVAKFAARKGRKRTYPREDIIEHFAWLREHGYTKKTKIKETGEVYFTEKKYTQATLRREYVVLQEFFRFIEDRSDWKMPISRVKVPTADELNQPILTHDQVEDLIVSTVIEKLPINWIVRLAVSTLYGARVSELTDITFHLDGVDSSVYIKTRKRGERRRQPLPAALLPIFAIPMSNMTESSLRYAFRSMSDKMGWNLPERFGWHSIRRRVVTDVYSSTNVKDIPIANFFRWRVGGIGQLPTYVKVPTETSDTEILKQHPFLEVWETLVPLLMELHPEYARCIQAQEIYHDMKILVYVRNKS